MLTVPIISCVEEIVASRGVNANGQASTIRCYTYPVITTSPRRPLTPDRELAVESMTLFMRIESEVIVESGPFPATHALAAKSGYPPAPTLGAP